MHHRHHLLLLSLAVAILIVVPTTEGKLSVDYYKKTCPNLQNVVQQTVTNKQIATPSTGAGVLRLIFHDCFATGCDASILISSNTFNKAERDADINLSLPGDAFDVVVRAKTALEVECPGIVSCADILALAARDLVIMLGGPYFKVQLGRKDSLTSRASDVEGKLPKPTMPIPEIITLFKNKGFTVQEMVALTGAHTVGFSHCKEFADRVFSNASDPSLNPRFKEGLRKACHDYKKRTTVAAFNDIMTPNKFDNLYFQNLPRGLGLLSSDVALLTDPETRSFVLLYAANQTAFFKDFVLAMEKLSLVDAKIGKKGEVRRRCDEFNDFNTAGIWMMDGYRDLKMNGRTERERGTMVAWKILYNIQDQLLSRQGEKTNDISSTHFSKASCPCPNEILTISFSFCLTVLLMQTSFL